MIFGDGIFVVLVDYVVILGMLLKVVVMFLFELLFIVVNLWYESLGGGFDVGS